MWTTWVHLVRELGRTRRICGAVAARPRKSVSSRNDRFGRTKKWQALRENMIELCDA
jgi:hypothetical protein